MPFERIPRRPRAWWRFADAAEISGWGDPFLNPTFDPAATPSLVGVLLGVAAATRAVSRRHFVAPRESANVPEELASAGDDLPLDLVTAAGKPALALLETLPVVAAVGTDGQPRH
jgi:hypothetical protein